MSARRCAVPWLTLEDAQTVAQSRADDTAKTWCIWQHKVYLTLRVVCVERDLPEPWALVGEASPKGAE